MNKRVDVAIAFYGKPMQTIIAIKSLLQYSGQYIDKIYLTQEQNQPHQDWGGVYKVIDYFREEPVQFVVYRPVYFLSTNVTDIERTRQNTWYRHSIMYQYALEKTDKPYLCIVHNDMLFHADMIGPMLSAFDQQPELAGTGSVGQCWACPAWLDKRCSPTKVEEYKPGKEEAIALFKAYNPPRLQRNIEIMEGGRVWPLPECRLNEHSALINVDLYRKTTVPVGDVGCLGGTWEGADLGMIWFYEMMNRGYKFGHFVLEDYALHAPFDDSGSGSLAYNKSERYWLAEQAAVDYINANYPRKAKFGTQVKVNTFTDAMRRNSRRLLLRMYNAVNRR